MPDPSTTPGAVFLSYASQDAEAALRRYTALRAASLEVWFGRSELDALGIEPREGRP